MKHYEPILMLARNTCRHCKQEFEYTHRFRIKHYCSQQCNKRYLADTHKQKVQAEYNRYVHPQMPMLPDRYARFLIAQQEYYLKNAEIIEKKNAKALKPAAKKRTCKPNRPRKPKQTKEQYLEKQRAYQRQYKIDNPIKYAKQQAKARDKARALSTIKKKIKLDYNARPETITQKARLDYMINEMQEMAEIGLHQEITQMIIKPQATQAQQVKDFNRVNPKIYDMSDPKDWQ